MTETRSHQDTLATDTDTDTTAIDTSTETNGNGGSAVDIQSRAMRGASFLFGREAIGSVVRLVGIIITVRDDRPERLRPLHRRGGLRHGRRDHLPDGGRDLPHPRQGRAQRSPEQRDLHAPARAPRWRRPSISIGLSFALVPLLRPVGVALPLRVLLLCVPINVLWAPAQAYIERRFDYKKMGILELGGDFVLYATAVPLAILHFGAWSLVIGYFAWQSFLLIGSLILSGLRPRWAWSTATAKDVIRHGTSYSTSVAVREPASRWSTRSWSGTFVGAAGVGYVSFAPQPRHRRSGSPSAAPTASGIVTMSQINRDDPSKFRQGLERGSFLLTLALGVPFAIFGLAAHWIIPDLFGHEWAASLPDLLPAVAGLRARHRRRRSKPRSSTRSGGT